MLSMNRIEIRLLCDQLDEDQIVDLLNELKMAAYRFINKRGIEDVIEVNAIHYEQEAQHG
jgi:hypothetical protein